MNPRPSTPTNDLDELLDALSHPSRRRVLTRLARDEDGFELAAVAEGDELDGEAVDLLHNHLPKLADAGFLDWDRERNVVTRGPQFHEIEPLVDLIVTHEEELSIAWP